jgi:hypothetical protein
MRLFNKNDRFLGLIYIGKQAYVSDPCYDIGEENIIDNMSEGLYRCFLTYDSTCRERVARIFIEKDLKDTSDYEFIECDSVMVDSGQCGIFDYNYYKSKYWDETGLYYNKTVHENWYESICDLTYVAERNPEYLSLTKFKIEYNTLEKLVNCYLDFTEGDKNIDSTLESIKEEEAGSDAYESYFSMLTLLIYMKYREINPESSFHLTGSTLDESCVVSSAGYGDGEYSVYVTKDEKGEVNSIQILFIKTDFQEMVDGIL